MNCGLCQQKLGARADVWLVDDEWPRRLPAMTGKIVCRACSLDTDWGRCDDNGIFSHGHVAPPRQRSICDAMTHTISAATLNGAIMIDPWSAVAQGGREEVLALSRRDRLNPQIREAVLEALGTPERPPHQAGPGQ